MMWRQRTSQMTDWCGGRGQVKWLTDVVIRQCSMSSTSTSSISSASTSTSSDWWCGGSGQVKWLTDMVAGGKSNDWLMQWYGNTLCLALALPLSLVLVLVLALMMWWQWASQMTDWCGGRRQVKWLADAVIWQCSMSSTSASSISSASSDWLCGGSGQANDWLMWWQGASQMIDWCSDMVMLYV